MKRIILSGGGTGGHIYPAITIAREILKIEEAEILFIGTPDGICFCINSGFGIKKENHI